MENSYFTPASSKSPEIIGNVLEGKLSIKGKSLPENARDFYGPFKEWLVAFYASPCEILTVTIELEYYNTVSSKVLLTLMRELKTLKSSKEIKIEWRYEKDDYEMEEAGLDFKNLVGDTLVMTAITLK